MPSEKVQVSVGGGSRPRWRRDAKEIFYLSPRSEIVAVPVLGLSPLKLGAPAPLFAAVAESDLRNGWAYYEVMSADGSRFMASRAVSGQPHEIQLVVNWQQELAGSAK